MSDSLQTSVTVKEEELPLNDVAGSGDNPQNDDHQVPSSPGGRKAFLCCEDKHHRNLAICSIICGCSCIGYKALINSVQAEKTEDPERAEKHLQKAKKFGIISIVTWFAILAAIPVLMGLISYLLTLID